MDEIRAELYKALERLGAPAGLLGIIGAWGDGLTDAEVLAALQAHNAGDTLKALPGTPPVHLVR